MFTLRLVVCSGLPQPRSRSVLEAWIFAAQGTPGCMSAAANVEIACSVHSLAAALTSAIAFLAMALAFSSGFFRGRPGPPGFPGFHDVDRLPPRGIGVLGGVAAGLFEPTGGLFGCGGRIRTCGLQVMSLTSYRTAPPRKRAWSETVGLRICHTGQIAQRKVPPTPERVSCHP